MTDLTWICDTCEKPVADGDGYIFADPRLADEYALAQDKLGQIDGPFRVFDVTELLSGPDPAQWHAAHLGCLPDPNGHLYCIDVERIRTLAQVTRWTSHIMGKNWGRFTDWTRVMAAQATAIDEARSL